MKKKFKSNKGFSLVELLIVLAILAIVAAISITVFGNVMTNSKDKADAEQAANIKRAIQTYMAESNDVNLSGLSHGTAAALIGELQASNTIGTNTENDTPGTYGPYLDAAVTIVPQNTTHSGWDIDVDDATMEVTVVAATDDMDVN